ncbi:MAG: SRPBCC family protein [Bacteroidaceae bacterium]|nr:SRPBCC family protein [Bacteroidaceae bacterium]
MKRFESQVKQIPYAQHAVYAKVSDLSNLREIADRIPQDSAQFKIEDLECTPDRVSCTIQPVGGISLHIVSREPEKCVKMETDRSPIALTFWIQIVALGESACKMKLTLDADVNIFMAKMVEKPLTEALEKLADMLAMIPYE